MHVRNQQRAQHDTSLRNYIPCQGSFGLPPLFDNRSNPMMLSPTGLEILGARMYSEGFGGLVVVDFI